MARKVRFKRVKRPKTLGRGFHSDVRARVAHAAAKWFHDLTGLTAIGVALPRAVFADPGALSRFQPPSCAGCRVVHEDNTWAKHLAELQRHPAAHWHRCEGGRLCAVVPAIVSGQCVAACKLVDDGRTPEAVFERHVELLNTLVEASVAEYAEALQVLVAKEAAAEQRVATEEGDSNPRRWHHGVSAAVDHIREHLANPGLTVGRVAAALGMNSTYLGHLFARDVGMTMRQYIARQRLERAKALLVSTTWAVKRIARATGHGNPDWFSHVFRTSTGMTPTTYRQNARNADPRP